MIYLIYFTKRPTRQESQFNFITQLQRSCSVLFHAVPFHSVLPFRSISRRSIRFDFIPFRSNLSFQSVPIYSAPPHSIFLPFYSILFQSISLRSIFTQFCFIPSRYLLHSIPCHSILFCSDPFRPVSFDSVPFFVRFLPIPFCSVPIRPSFIQFHSTVL